MLESELYGCGSIVFNACGMWDMFMIKENPLRCRGLMRRKTTPCGAGD